MAGTSVARLDSFELHFVVANTWGQQATLDMTGTLPSSLSREGCSKSVRSNFLQHRPKSATAMKRIDALLDGGKEGVPEGLVRTMMLMAGLGYRICLQGDHSREHHVDWCPGQGLRRSPVPEEGAGRLSFQSAA